MITIKDIAKKANVSTATVSRVINNGPKVGKEKRKHVQQIMQELGYRPNENARALVTQKTSTIGVIVPDISDPFFAALASGVNKVASEQNLQMLLGTGGLTESSERNAINLLLSRRCDIIVMHSKKLSDAELTTFCEKVPGLIIIDRQIEGLGSRCIFLDNQAGGEIAASHLLSLKHTQIACILSNFDIDDPALRLMGLQKGLKASNITLDDRLVKYAEPNQKGGQLAAQSLIDSKLKFSAIFAYNDAMAIGAMSVLIDSGLRVPQDISIVGFDNVILAQFSNPKLTTLHYPIEEMAARATEMAVANYQVDAGVKPQQSYVPSLIVRHSTALFTE